MDQLEQNQAALREEVSQVRSQMGKLMETIQEVARGQEIMAKMQEEMNQRAHAANPLIPSVVETHAPPPQGNPPVHVSAPGSVPSVNINPPIIEVYNQHDAFFNPMVASLYEAFGPTTNEVEKKVKAIKEKLKAMESSDVLGLNVAEMCLVLGVIILPNSKSLTLRSIREPAIPKPTSEPTAGKRLPTRKMTNY